MSVEIVWYKRDLRIADHAPLTEAARRGPVVALYLYEPGLWATPEYDAAHLHFIEESLDALDRALRARGGRLTRRVGPAVEVLQALAQELEPNGGIRALRSHRETGNLWTYARDRAVARWCRARGIPWFEVDQDGVCRPHPRRDGWARRWEAWMAAAPTPPPDRVVDVATLVPDWRHDHGRPTLPGWRAALGTAPPDLPVDPLPPHVALQPGGAEAGEALVRAFLARGVEGYPRGIGSPSTGPDVSSRLSPHLAWGTVSLRTVHQHQRLHLHRVSHRRDAEAEARRASLTAFGERLRWRSHFIQRLEDAPTLERDDLHEAVTGLRDRLDPELHDRWREGRTGWPMVDACMRALRVWRWLPFRMRALLVSTHSYLLWQPWQPAARHLASLFLDFEPGIHYSQVQMQSGATGISELRVYDPEKQGRDHDPDGAFIRAWVPELAGVAGAAVHRPWTLDAAAQRASGCRIGLDYPAPPVDAAGAATRAKRALEGLRATPEARAQARAVHERVGSRRRNRGMR